MATVDLFDRITVEPGKCGGKPCIRGMRITVRRVLELLASYPDRTAVLADYPYLEPEDLQILERPRLDGRVCITLDHDFHTHLAIAGGSPSMVFLRVQAIDAQGQADLIRSAVSADREKTRIRHLPLR